MNEIIYRDIKKSDYEDIKNLINTSFFIEDYVEDEKVLNFELECELYEALIEQSYTCIAEKDGEVIGFIMGQAEEDYNIFDHLGYYCKYYIAYIKWKVRAWLKKDSLEDSIQLNETYDYFLKNSKENYDGVLSLFIVSSKAQGYGIGKELMRRFQNYLRENDVEKFYLFTDSFCNYGYYDYLGFKRKNKKLIKYLRNNKKKDLNVYLYSYEM